MFHKLFMIAYGIFPKLHVKIIKTEVKKSYYKNCYYYFIISKTLLSLKFFLVFHIYINKLYMFLYIKKWFTHFLIGLDILAVFRFHLSYLQIYLAIKDYLWKKLEEVLYLHRIFQVNNFSYWHFLSSNHVIRSNSPIIFLFNFRYFNQFSIF